MTPLIIPAIPTTIKFETDKLEMPVVLIKKASANPVSAPVNKEGAKIPPFPPAPIVREVAKILTRIMMTVNNRRNQGLD